MKNLTSSVFAVCLSAFIMAAPAYAEKNTSKGMPDEATMKKMMEVSAPGEQHKILNSLVGNWNYTVTYKMAPDAPEQKSTGTSANAWVMDGRFVQQDTTGSMDMGGKTMKFEGMGLIGHDNVKGEYKSVWIDSMNTGMMTSSGKYDAATKTIKESGEFSCPMKGLVKFNTELRFVDANHYTYTMYDSSSEGGKPFKSMEIEFTRK